MGAGECGDDVGTRPRGASAAMRARRRFFSQPADETPLDWRTICAVRLRRLGPAIREALRA
jgi:hypothetical protein